MSAKPRDPLLASARIIVCILIGVMIFAMVMVGIGTGALLTVKRADILAEAVKVSAPDTAYWLVVVAMLFIEGLLYLALQFFTELNRIIGSVGEGEAFNPVNAQRLSRMGWFVVGAQGLGLVLGSIAAYLAPYAEKAGHDTHLGFGLDGGGILTALLLFILARVFREGARMRADLEGTV
ncbi:MAG: DUF2975 domain-containing protein [Novosphingobium sp.]